MRGTIATDKYVQGFWGYTRLAPEGMNDSRVKSGQVRLITDHGRAGAAPAGIVNSVHFEASTGEYIMDFDIEGPRKEEIEQSIASGLYDLSIGAAIDDMELDEMGDAFWDDKWTATEWEFIEASLTPMPADVDARIARSAETAPFGSRGERDMGLILSRAANSRIEERREAFRATLAAERAVDDQENEVNTNGEETDVDKDTDTVENEEETQVTQEEEPTDDESGDDDREDEEDDREDEEDDREDEGDDSEEEDMDEEERTEGGAEERSSTSTPRKVKSIYTQHELDAMREIAKAAGKPGEVAEAVLNREKPKDFLARMKQEERYTTNILPHATPVKGEEVSLERVVRAHTLRATERGAGQMYANAMRDVEHDFNLMAQLGIDERDINSGIPFALLGRMLGADTEAAERMLERASTIGGNTGTYMSNVNYAYSAGWLVEMIPLLQHMAPLFVTEGQQKFYYGNEAGQPSAAPVPQLAAAGEASVAIPESVPTTVEIALDPKPRGTFYRVASSLKWQSGAPMLQLFLDGARRLMEEKVMRAFLSGPNERADFSAETVEPFNGIYAQLTETTITTSATVPVDREDLLSLERELVINKATNRERFAVFSPLLYFAMAGRPYNVVERAGGGAANGVAAVAASVIESGMVHLTEDIPAYPSVQLGKPSTNNPAMLVDGAACVPVFWGGGIEVREFQPPGEAADQVGLLTHVNFALINPKNGRGLKTSTASV